MKPTTISLVLLLGAVTLNPCRAPAQPASTPPAAPAATVKPSDLFPDAVIAKGKNVEIKRSQLEDEVMHLRARAAAQGQKINPEQMPLYEQGLLEDLIRIQILRAKATLDDKAAATKMAAKKMEDAVTQLGSSEALDRQLKAVDLSRQDLLSKWTDAATAENVLKRELSITVTDEDVKKFYDENPSRFEQPEMVRASHILLMTIDPKTKAELSKELKEAKHKQIEDILKRARAGEDFAKLAKEFSEDPGSKDNGGEYKFPRGQMVPEFEAAAFSLNTNQVSDIVTTQYGYHIIKLSEKIPAKKIELAAVADRVKQSLLDQAIQKQFATYYAKVKKEAKVEILDEKLKPKESPADASAAQPLIANPSPAKAK
ncbi:MAG: peptidylprolyl isomerase [Limisphaerales bacterium]